MQRKTHWEQVYTTKQPDAVSWYQPHVAQLQELIRTSGVAPDTAIIDVGGHVIAATFADDGPTHCSGLLVARYSRRIS